jgi:hypothetical protein
VAYVDKHRDNFTVLYIRELVACESTLCTLNWLGTSKYCSSTMFLIFGLPHVGRAAVTCSSNTESSSKRGSLRCNVGAKPWETGELTQRSE